MKFRYRVVITNVTELSSGEVEATGITEVLSMRVDELHEIAPKLAALYPPPVVKRAHRKKEATA